jgi:axial budding pattern protein 2
MSSSMLYIVVILAAISVVTAAPTLVFPIAAQLPPVGRVSSPFDFALLPGTFNSTSTIQYTTSTRPDWLTFDSVALSFYGTPTASDVGQTDITVTASDGSTTDDAFTLLVTDAPSPGIHKSIPSQIADPALHNFATAVPLPSNSGVVIHPYYSFSLGFQQNSFRPALDATAAQSSIYYSAHERGRVDLPSWLNFDNRTVTFYGNAPSDGSYIIVVVGSDVWGYEAVESSFVIEVSTTSIGFIAGHGLGNITTVAGAKLEYTFDLTGLAVNGQVINDTSSIRIQADLEQFDWLSLDRLVSLPLLRVFLLRSPS